MKKIAIFPGSFDPVTKGHLNLFARASLLFDELHVAIGVSSGKSNKYTVEQRVEFIKNAVEHLPAQNIFVHSYSGLTIHFAEKMRACAIVRGIRNHIDYEYEKSMLLMNRNLNPNIETIFLEGSPDLIHISSSLVKELMAHGQDISSYVPEIVAEAIKKTKAPK